MSHRVPSATVQKVAPALRLHFLNDSRAVPVRQVLRWRIAQFRDLAALRVNATCRSFLLEVDIRVSFSASGLWIRLTDRTDAQ